MARLLDWKQRLLYQQISDNPGITFNPLAASAKPLMSRQTVRKTLREMRLQGVIGQDSGRHGQKQRFWVTDQAWYTWIAHRLKTMDGLRIDIERMLSLWELSTPTCRGRIIRQYHEFVGSLT